MSNSSVAGLRITGSDPTLANDDFINNNGTAISLYMASQPDIANPTVTGNGTNADVLDGGTIASNVTWGTLDSSIN